MCKLITALFTCPAKAARKEKLAKATASKARRLALENDNKRKADHPIH